MKATLPILKMLRRFDTNGPTIGKLYSSWFELGEHFETATESEFKQHALDNQDADNAERVPACRPSAGHSVPQCRPVQAYGRALRAQCRPSAGTPCPSAGQCRPSAGTPMPQCRPCRPSAGHSVPQCRPTAGTPSPQCRPVPAFGLQPALHASIVHQCRPCFRVPNAPSHRVHVQASAALPLPA